MEHLRILNGPPGRVIWLTGLPGAGKTTIGKRLVRRLRERGRRATLLDGDDIRRSALSIDCGFSPEDRRKHLLRVAFMARRLAAEGVEVVAAFVSPSRAVRAAVAAEIGPAFAEVYVDCGLPECERRDPKGLYAKARRGEIAQFTGVSAPYEPPDDPDVRVSTERAHPERSADEVLAALYDAPRALCIGRYSPFHNGHKSLIDKLLAERKRVLVGVRERPVSRGDPWPAAVRAAMVRAAYPGDPRVETVILPDIESVNIGRAVGYEVRTHELGAGVESISATRIRERIDSKNPAWQADVPPGVARFLMTET